MPTPRQSLADIFGAPPSLGEIFGRPDDDDDDLDPLARIRRVREEREREMRELAAAGHVLPNDKAEALGEDPGIVGPATRRFANAATGWLYGLAERVTPESVIPTGTRQAMNEALDEERIQSLAHGGAGRAVTLVGAELGGAVGGGVLIPGGAAKAGAAAAARLGPQAGRAIGAAVGAAEGGLQGFAETAGLSRGEQQRGMLLGAGLGGALPAASAMARSLPADSILARPLGRAAGADRRVNSALRAEVDQLLPTLRAMDETALRSALEAAPPGSALEKAIEREVFNRAAGTAGGVPEGQAPPAISTAKPKPLSPAAARAVAATGDPFSAVMVDEIPATTKPAAERLQSIADRVTDEFLNKEDAPLRRLRRAGMGKEADYLEMLQARARGSGAIAKDVVTGNTFRYDPATQGTVPTGPGLNAVLGGVDEATARDLNAYMAAEHHGELVQRKAVGQAQAAAQAEMGFPPPADALLNIDGRGSQLAADKLAALAGKYGARPDGRVARLAELADGVRDWSIRAVLDPLEDAGRLSPDMKAAILAKNERYAPFFRLVDELGEDPEILVGSTKANPLHKISGGLSPDRPIGLPLESMVEQAQKVTVWAERQRVRNVFAAGVDANPALQAEIVASRPRGRGESPPPRGGTFPVWRNGERVDYQAPADVIRAFERMTPKQVPLALEVAGIAARTLRAGVTLTLPFGLRNPLRDLPEGALFQKGFNPVKSLVIDPLAGLFDVTIGGRWSQEWRANGGSASDIISYARPDIQASLADAMAQGPAAKAVRAVARRWGNERLPKPLRAIVFPALAPLEALTEVLEKAPKVGAYRRLRLRGESPLSAAALSRDIGSPDFGRSGSAGQAWNHVEAFANPELQGIYRYIRAMRRAPGATTLKTMAYITLPAIANWAAWKDDPDYQNLPEWERASFLHTHKREDGRFGRYPRQPGLVNALWGYGVQKFLDGVSGKDPQAAEQFVGTFIDQSPLHYIANREGLNIYDLAPTALQPAFEASAGEGGYSRFRDTSIVPEGQQDVLPEDQTGSRTTAMARRIGEAAGVSPYKVDHLIRGYGGTWATIVAQSEAMGGTGMAEEPPRDLPQRLGFASVPAVGFASEPVIRTYRLAHTAAQAKESMDLASNSGDSARYHRILRDHPEVLLNDDLQDMRRQLSELRKERKSVEMMRDLTPEARADLLLQLDMMATQLAGPRMHAWADWLRGQRGGVAGARP